MNKEKTSPIWTVSKEHLQELINNQTSIALVLADLGISSHSSGSYISLKKRIEQDGIDLSLFIDNRKKKQLHHLSLLANKIAVPDSKMFCVSSKIGRGAIKKRILTKQIIPYRCECGITDIWNKKPIVLVLDHINGNNTDYRIHNLRFLCPNCNSQTSTFCGRKKRKRINFCSDCGRQITKKSKQCLSCYNKNKPKKYVVAYSNRPSKDELQKMIDTMPMTLIGKKYGISDNSIRKWCKNYGIELKNRLGYWTKVKYNEGRISVDRTSESESDSREFDSHRPH